MANPKQDLNAVLSGIDKLVLEKKRVMTTDLFEPKERNRLVTIYDEAIAAYTKRAKVLALKSGSTMEMSKYRQPRKREKPRANGQTKSA